jgi:hypothetical protein
LDAVPLLFWGSSNLIVGVRSGPLRVQFVAYPGPAGSTVWGRLKSPIGPLRRGVRARGCMGWWCLRRKK